MNALFANYTGSYNVAIGYAAGYNDPTGNGNHYGSNSIFIGANTLSSSSIAYTNQIVIGSQATGSGSNTVTIGNSNITANYFKGTINTTGDVVAYYSSDERLKDNITPISNALDKVKQIGGYEFDWNDKQSTYEGHDVGVIAQEIEAILPELVTTRDNGYKAVKYEKIIALLIEAIKEQQLEIEEIKKRLNE
jgi:hypothetical protein